MAVTTQLKPPVPSPETQMKAPSYARSGFSYIFWGLGAMRSLHQLSCVRGVAENLSLPYVCFGRAHGKLRCDPRINEAWFCMPGSTCRTPKQHAIRKRESGGKPWDPYRKRLEKPSLLQDVRGHEISKEQNARVIGKTLLQLGHARRSLDLVELHAAGRFQRLLRV